MGATSAIAVAAACTEAVDEQRVRASVAGCWLVNPCTRAPLIVKRWQGYGGHPRQAQAVDWPLGKGVTALQERLRWLALSSHNGPSECPAWALEAATQ